jgi:hypothetical protein
MVDAVCEPIEVSQVRALPAEPLSGQQLAVRIREVFLASMRDLSGDEMSATSEPTRIGIDVRRLPNGVQLLVIGLDESDLLYWCYAWNGDEAQAFRFADDAGIAAGMELLD